MKNLKKKKLEIQDLETKLRFEKQTLRAWEENNALQFESKHQKANKDLKKYMISVISEETILELAAEINSKK